MRLTRSLYERVRPACPLFINKLDNSYAVAFSDAPTAVAMGKFSEQDYPEFFQGFSTEPDKFEPQKLIQRPDRFVENRQFLPIAQAVLKDSIHTCPTFKALAEIESKTQFLHIFDLRCPPPIGRIPEVEDILGTVEVNNGKIVPKSYQPNTMYRPVTTFGAMMLSKEMAKKIAEATAQAN